MKVTGIIRYCTGQLTFYSENTEEALFEAQKTNVHDQSQRFPVQLSNVRYVKNRGSCCWRVCQIVQRRRRCEVFGLGEERVPLYASISRLLAHDC